MHYLKVRGHWRRPRGAAATQLRWAIFHCYSLVILAFSFLYFCSLFKTFTPKVITSLSAAAPVVLPRGCLIAVKGWRLPWKRRLCWATFSCDSFHGRLITGNGQVVLSLPACHYSLSHHVSFNLLWLCFNFNLRYTLICAFGLEREETYLARGN